MTQREVAKVLGVSQAVIFKIEHRAMKKLRANPEARALLDYINRVERRSNNVGSLTKDEMYGEEVA